MAEAGAYRLYSSPGENMSQSTTRPWFSADLSHDNMCASGDLYLRAYGQLRNRMVTRTSLLRWMPRRSTRSVYRLGYVFFRNRRYSCPFLAELCAHVAIHTMVGHVLNTWRARDVPTGIAPEVLSKLVTARQPYNFRSCHVPPANNTYMEQLSKCTLQVDWVYLTSSTFRLGQKPIPLGHHITMLECYIHVTLHQILSTTDDSLVWVAFCMYACT